MHSNRSTEKVIAQRYEQWWNALRSGQHERAYRMMSPQYRAKYSQADFYRAFIMAGEDWLRPHSGQKVHTYQLRATIFPRDSFSDGNGGPEYELLRVNGQWYFTGDYEYIYGSRNQLFAGH